MKTFRSTVVLAVVATAGLVLAGCSGTAGTGSSGTTAAASAEGTAELALEQYLAKPSAMPAWPALTTPVPKGKVVYYIHTGSAVGQIINDSLARAGAKLGWDVRTLTYSAANLATANSAYLTAVNSGANAIVSTGLNSKAIQEGLDAAKAAGVVVVQTQSEEDPATTSFRHVFNGKLNVAGIAKVDAMGYLADAEKGGTTAKVGVVTSSGIPVLRQTSQAVVDAIEAQCPQCTAALIDIPAAQASNGQAPSAVISYIQQHPETKYVDVPGPWAAGMRAALNGAGLSSVKIGGLQPTPAQNAELASGASLFWLQLPFGFQAWVAADTLARAFTGGDATIHDREAPLLWMVNKNNIDFDPKVLPDFPTGYEAAFAKLWNVS